MKVCRYIIPLLALYIVCSPASATVNAWLDHDQIDSGESVQLTLQRDSNSDTSPDLSPLKQNFDILGNSSGSSIQIVNGHVSTQRQIQLTLMPKHNGQISIPPLKWDGEQSPALEITVGASHGHEQHDNTPDSTNHSHVFLTSSADQKQPYVQSPITLTVKLYTDKPLYQASLDLPSNNDSVVQTLGKDQQTTETLNGHRYQVIERKYLVFPQHSGQLTLSGPILNAQVADTTRPDVFGNIFGNSPFSGMVNATRPIRIQGDTVTLNVRPLPSGNTAHHWLPAQHVTLTESWQPHNGTAQTGEPITWHLHLSAAGLTAEQLPDLSTLISLPDGIKAYPDQPKLNNSIQVGNILSSRDQDIALIANHPGHFLIPALHLKWWDTVQDVQREAVLPKHTLNILPGSGSTTNDTNTPADSGPSTTTPSNPPPPNHPTLTLKSSENTPSSTQADITQIPEQTWRWISAGLAILWCTTLIAWWRGYTFPFKRKPHNDTSNKPLPPSTPSPSNARKRFHEACRNHSPLQARQALLDWARATWPQHPPSGLNNLAQRLNNPQVLSRLRELDRACYTNSEWNGTSLANTLTQLPHETSTTPLVSELGGLYP